MRTVCGVIQDSLGILDERVSGVGNLCGLSRTEPEMDGQFGGSNRAKETRAADAIESCANDDRTKLSSGDKLNHDLFRKQIERDIEGTRFKGEFLANHQLGGVQQDVPELFEVMPHRSVAEYEDIIARLKGVPALVNQTLVLLKRVWSWASHHHASLYGRSAAGEKPIGNGRCKESDTARVHRISDDDARRGSGTVAAPGGDNIDERGVPAFRELHEFLVTKYLPGARESIGMSELA